MECSQLSTMQFVGIIVSLAVLFFGLFYLMICSTMEISPFTPNKSLVERDEKRQKEYDAHKEWYLDDMAREVKKRLERDDFA